MDDRELLSPIGRQFVAGLLDHARAMAVFGDPTTNAYARFRPYSFAPDRICWARRQPRRADPRPGRAGRRRHARREPALGEPAANPYLWLAANIAAGLDGIDRGAEPPPPVEGDPYAAEAPPAAAVARRGGRRRSSAATFYRAAFGDALVDYLVMMKRAELKRYDEAGSRRAGRLARSAWEMREYFEFY